MIKKISCLLAVYAFLFILGCGGGDGDTVVLGGYVLLNDDTPVQGVDVVFLWPAFLGDWEAIEKTDDTGWYAYKSKDRHPEYSVKITPEHPDYDFIPASYNLNDIRDSSVRDLDFLAVPK